MNEPQVWVLIGVFAAIMLGGFTLSTTLLMHSIKTSVSGVRETMDARFSSVENTMNARFETVDAKLSHLDRDVSAISRKVVDLPRE